MKYFQVKIFNINYDTDGEELDLPKNILVWVREDLLEEVLDGDELGDLISDETGFCHFGYNTEKTDLEETFEDSTREFFTC